MKPNKMFFIELWSHRKVFTGLDCRVRLVPIVTSKPWKVRRYLKRLGYCFCAYEYLADVFGIPALIVYVDQSPKAMLIDRAIDLAVTSNPDDPIAAAAQVLHRFYPPPKRA